MFYVRGSRPLPREVLVKVVSSVARDKNPFQPDAHSVDTSCSRRVRFGLIGRCFDRGSDPHARPLKRLVGLASLHGTGNTGAVKLPPKPLGEVAQQNQITRPLISADRHGGLWSDRHGGAAAAARHANGAELRPAAVRWQAGDDAWNRARSIRAEAPNDRGESDSDSEAERSESDGCVTSDARRRRQRRGGATDGRRAIVKAL